MHQSALSVLLLALAAFSPIPIHAQPASTIDLQAQAVSGPTSGVADIGGPLRVTYSIRNGGSLTAPPFEVLFGLVPETAGSTVRLGLVTEDGLAERVARSNAVRTFTVPLTAAPGSYRVSMTIDPGTLLSESNETNNDALAGTVTTLNTAASAPNLAVTTVSAGSLVQQGQSLTFTASIRNSGQATVSSFVADFGFALATTATSFTSLTRANGTTLGAGQQIELTTSVAVPLSISSGQYFAAVRLDPDGAIAETSETDNLAVSTSATTVASVPAPDLIPRSIAASPTVTAGANLAFSASIANSGDATAAAFIADFGLATTLTASQFTRLGSVPVAQIAARTTASVSIAFPVTAAISPGTYFAAVRVDATGVVAERDETNNFAISSSQTSVTTPPSIDLVALSASGPAQATVGQTFVVTGSARNAGTLTSPQFDASFVLSTDTAFTSTFRLGTVRSGGLGPDSAPVSLTGSFIVSSSISPGSYFVGLIVDPDTAVSEGNEANNRAASSGTVSIVPPPAPDLVPSAVTGPSGAQVGQAIAVSGIVSNSGMTSSPSFIARFVLTNGANFATQFVLGSVTAAPLATGGATSVGGTFTVTAGVPAGTYRIGLIADPANAVTESDEANNRAISNAPFTLSATPDLVAVSLTGAATAIVGSNLELQAEVHNAGGAAASSIAVHFLLQSATGPATRFLLGSETLASLAAETSLSISRSLSVTAGTAPGLYVPVLSLDPNKSIFELDESNNESMALSVVAVVSTVATTTVTVIFPPGLSLVSLPVAPAATSAWTAEDLLSFADAPWAARIDAGGRFHVFLPPLTESFSVTGNEGFLVGRGTQPARSRTFQGPVWPASQLTRALTANLAAVAYPRGVPPGEGASTLRVRAGSFFAVRSELPGEATTSRFDVHAAGLGKQFLIEPGRGYLVRPLTPRTVTLPPLY